MRLTRTFAMVLILAALLLPLLVGISYIQRQMNRIRITEQLTDTEPLRNAPPLVAFTTVALGGFRGLVADWLWLRSNKMQDEENYFEMVQLASWIVKLQPRFTGATAFLAWNMAYNISVTFHSFEERWKWVQRGIELIRDEALVYNPGDPVLFHELGWIYQHKVGKDLDDANRYYKTQMARQLMKAFGEYPVDWGALAASPETKEELVTALGEDTKLWSILEKNAMDYEELTRKFREEGRLPEKIAADLEGSGIEEVLVRHLRHRWLVEVYKLDPAVIRDLTVKYGKLDWRLPEAHAIYWASRGLEAARDELSIKCDRMIFQSLAAAFKGGRLIFFEDIKHLETTPNIDLVDAVNQSYVTAMENHGKKVIRGGYENFLVDAVVILYTFGQRKKAKEYFKIGREFSGKKRFYGTVEDFVLKELAGDMALATYNQAQGTIHGYLLQSCHALSIGDYDRAASYELIARHLWRKYMNSIGETTTERRGLPPYKQMKINVVKRALTAFRPGLRERLKAALPKGSEELIFDENATAEP